VGWNNPDVPWQELEAALAKGCAAVTQNAMAVCEADGIDAIVEVTGTVEFGAQVVLRAIEYGKHVVMMNAELDSTLGPLLKVKGDAARCCTNRVCEKVCPMDVRIGDYVQRGERVSASECILCQACIGVCPEDALTLSFGLDGGRPDLLNARQ